VSQVLHLFALYVGIGILALTPLVNHVRIQAGYFRLISMIAFVSLVVARLTLVPQVAAARLAGVSTQMALGFLLGLALVYLTLAWAGRPAWAGRMGWVLLAASAPVLALESAVHMQLIHGSLMSAALPLSLVTSAGMLGSVLLSMCLGHYYLTSPGLAVYHLHRLTTVFAVFVGASFLVFVAGAAGLVTSGALALSADPTLWIVSNLPFLAIRLFMGIIVPGVLSYRIDRFVRVRSTQKATGLLYVALVFILFGELVSAYLLVLTAVPT